MWNPQTNKSSKDAKTDELDPDTFRIYLQRTTPTIADIGIGKTVPAFGQFFVGEALIN